MQISPQCCVFQRAFFIVAGLVLAGSGLSSCTRSSAPVAEPALPQAYSVTMPVVMDVPADRQYVASVQNTSHIELCARVEGFIEKVVVDEGQRVAKGQLIFSIGRQAFETELHRARAKLKSAQADLRMAEIEQANTAILLGKKIIAKVDMELAQAKTDAAAAAVEEAGADVADAERHLSLAEVRAPFDGIINRLPKKAGSLVNVGDVLTTLSSDGDVFVYFNVSEQEYLELISRADYTAPGGLSLELADGNAYPHQGRIETVDAVIDKSMGTIAFRGRFPNPDHVLRQGASCKVTVRRLLKQVVVIPQKCTFELQHRLCVYRVGQDNKVQMEEVVPLFRLPNHFVIGRGLSAQDRVIFEGIQLVQEGQVIEPREQAWAASAPL